MVDFGKLRKQQAKPTPVDPEEIFLRLPKSPGLDDLWNSQADALKKWYSRRTERDIVIKLNTGGGKTLVGLLIAQSILHEQHGPVLYLCPTAQLQGQIIEQSQRYGISTVPYEPGQGNNLSEEFLGAKAIMIATYHALFNGRSRFGVSGAPREAVQLKGIVLDDAHTAFSNMREIFTLAIKREEHKELYNELTTWFRNDFEQQGRQGSFDDIVSEREDYILEIPYMSWVNRSGEVRERISHLAEQSFLFEWPLIRDYFDQCHALISKKQFVITPIFPMMHFFPSFTECYRRIYMSATVSDDSSIVSTFDADPSSIASPISPASLAGVGERMILIPELTKLDKSSISDHAKQLATCILSSKGVVILTSSSSDAEQWSDIATVAKGNDVATSVRSLVKGLADRPYVFPNRYDGIDLPGDSCRLLILAGIPYGSNVYDLFRSTVLEGSGAINAALAQRVEQGMGRGTRGGGDHCVVLLLGRDLSSWVSRNSNLKLLTNTTRAQVQIGVQISQEISSVTGLHDSIDKSLTRSPDWTSFHADVLADSATRASVDSVNVKIASAERRYFDKIISGNPDKAVGVIETFVRNNDCIDSKMKGWLLELGARAANLNGNVRKRDLLQREAYALNRNLHRPVSETQYTPLFHPTRQAESFTAYIDEFAFARGALADFEKIADHLVPSATSGQFEEALKNLGDVLGFTSERPEKSQNIGPDVLWVLNDRVAWIIEVKSQKQTENMLTKKEHGQLLQSCEWFEKQYPYLEGVRVVAHPNCCASDSVTVGSTMALTLPRLGHLISSVRTLLEDLTAVPMEKMALASKCEGRLVDLSLTPAKIGTEFLVPFVNQSVKRSRG